MTVSDGRCDFCGVGYLLVSGDESSVFFHVDEKPVLWCGNCSEGSKVYFERFTTDRLDELMNKAIQMLRDDPIQWKDRTDDAKTHLRKIFIDDDIGRARRELAFRKVR